MNRRFTLRAIGFKPRLLACILLVSLLSSCATIPRDVDDLGTPISVETSVSKREIKTLISLRKEVEDLRTDIKDLRSDIKKSDLTSKIDATLFKNQLKTFGCGCLTGVVISGLFVLFTGRSTTSN